MMRVMVSRRLARVLQAALSLVAALAFAGCSGPAGPLKGRASDEWTRTYTLHDGGEFQVVGAVGTIEVQGGDGPTVEVKAERIGRSATDEGAKPIPARVRLVEEVSPEKVVIRNDGLGGVQIGVEVEVNFHVTVPRGTKLRLRTAGGDITVSGVTGTVVASTTNGAITGSGLSGGIEARSTNGNITIGLTAVSMNPVELRATNGAIALTLPPTADANIDASCTNGSIEVQGLALERTGEQSERRTRGRLNAGGAPVQLSSTNGSIRISAAP